MGNAFLRGAFGRELSPQLQLLSELRLDEIEAIHERLTPSQPPRTSSSPRRPFKRPAKIAATRRCKPHLVDSASFCKLFVELPPKAKMALFRAMSEEHEEQRMVDPRLVLCVALMTLNAVGQQAKSKMLFSIFMASSSSSSASAKMSVAEVSRACYRALVVLSKHTKGFLVPSAAEEITQHLLRRTAEEIGLSQWLVFARRDAGAQAIFAAFDRRTMEARFVTMQQQQCSSRPATAPEGVISRGPRHPIFFRYPALVREIKRELVTLRKIFDFVDVDRSGSVSREEFLSANEKHAQTTVPPTTNDAFTRRLAESLFGTAECPSGDKSLTWEGLIRAKYHSYGSAAIKEITSWTPNVGNKQRLASDASDNVSGGELVRRVSTTSSSTTASSSRRKKTAVVPPTTKRRASSTEPYKERNRRSVSGLRIEAAIADVAPNHLSAVMARELSRLFASYHCSSRGFCTVRDLASAMAESHFLDVEDLLKIFDMAGRDQLDTLDDELFVDLFKDLCLGDASMSAIFNEQNAHLTRLHYAGTDKIIVEPDLPRLLSSFDEKDSREGEVGGEFMLMPPPVDFDEGSFRPTTV